MDVRLLGPVEASVDGRAVAVGAGKPRALLAMLALNAGSTVSSDRLIEGLWGEPPPATAAKLVQVHVSQLRKALAAAGDGMQIVTRGHGYELRLGPDDLDVTRFERLVTGGKPREALALWRGPALDDVAGEPFAAAEIQSKPLGADVTSAVGSGSNVGAGTSRASALRRSSLGAADRDVSCASGERRSS